ncbi:MAG: NAD(P)/FAD-dependent oxidoreductase [Clostridia bacterium]|nr:NAD(P)/FAD-dependent oxidoreductase [Clostridia bacterium]
MDILVIGAGPSGLISSYICSKNGHNVTLLEKNEKVGKKLYITGKGRCNVTNNCDPNTFLNSVVTNSKFMYGSLFSFSPQDTIDLLEQNGCKLKTERGNRVFPESDKSSDIIKTLKDLATNSGTNIILNQQVVDCYKNKEKFIVKTNDKTYESDCLILCTGGASYKATGSDGFGYKLAKKFGHTITSIRPALCPIKLNNSWIKSVEGLSLKNVELSAYFNNKLIKSEFGEMLFTSSGISGPISLTISSYINKYDNVDLYLDFKPALSFEKLENRIIREIEANKNLQINTMLRSLLPKNLVPIFLKVCKFDETKKLNSITVEDRKLITKNLKHFKLSFNSIYDIDYAIVTSGGVNVKEINPKTMESKLVKNLFFAGEILDVDALTGGYNIQIALSTGVSAGKGVL